MNVDVRPGMSLDEFLAWKNQQGDRWEFDGFEPRLLVGGTTIHNQIVGALEFAIRRQLAPPCRIYQETVKLRLANSVRYPDLMIVCSPLTRATELFDPLVVVEVISPSTAKADRIEKNREYAAAASIRRYIVLEQDAVAAEVYCREGGWWVRSTVEAGGVLAMPEIGVAVPLDEVYAGLPMEPAAPDAS